MTDIMNNTKHPAPTWMVNLTGILALLTPSLPSLIATLPGNVSDATKDWLSWMLQALTAVSAAITMFSKSNKNAN